jgi:uncharacterized protein (DUF433 family)
MPAVASWITRRAHPDGAEACIRDTNVNVWGLVERRWHGLDNTRILADIQGLTEADLEAAWAYYHDHPDEIEEAIRRNAEA